MATKPKAKARPKKANYARPETVKLGTILADFNKKNWRVGPSIGSGGFGDIYSCGLAEGSSTKPDQYTNVVKIEPHANGPLFVEMHFYMKNGKKDDIEKFRLQKGWPHLGVPYLVGHGSQDVNGERHRFLVIPRFSTDIWKLFESNNRRLPEHTVYRIGIQILHVLEYMHSRSYVHGDVKGANILLGMGKTGASQCYLVDFGLACHYTTKDFKADPKKAHNGTIEYTSRDAHQGVSTMRGDLEILGFNLVHWLGLGLPWETQKILGNAKKVHEAKEEYMQNLDKSLRDAPEAVVLFMKNVNKLKFDETPSYQTFHSALEKGLKAIGKQDKGDLEFDTKKTTKLSSPVKRIRKKSVSKSPKTPKELSPSPRKRKVPPSTAKPQLLEISPIVIDDDSPVVQNSPARKKRGNLVVNNKITPVTTLSNGKKLKKTYEFNLELDVSLEADVVVNIKRKKKSLISTNGKDAATTPKSATTSPVRKKIARSVKVTPSGTVRVEKR